MKKREFLTALGATIMAVPASVIASKQSQKGINSTHKKSTTTSSLQTIKNTGKLKSAYINYEPGFMKSPATGKFEGIFYDCMEQIAKNAGFTMDWVEEISFATIFEGFKTNRYQVVASSVWMNAPRSMQGDFTMPLYYSGVSTYVRNDDNRFKNVEDLNSKNYTLATIDGEMTATIAEEHFPKAKTLALSHHTPVADVLMNVITGKADATFVEDDVANKFMKKNSNTIKKLGVVFAVPNVIALPQGQEELKAMLNSNIEILQNTGFLERTIHNYEEVPNTLLRLKTPYEI